MTRFRVEFIAISLALGVSAFFALHVLHFAHRNEAERTVWTALPFWQTLEAFEYRLYDARFSARGKVLPQSHDKIAIVGIDEETFRSGSWPMPRSRFASLIKRLKAAGARVIVIDVDLSQPQNPQNDAALENAIRDAGNVLLVSYLTPERVAKESMQTKGADVGVLWRATTPIERFDQWTPDLALAYIPLDSDGRARRYPFYGIINDASVGGLATLSCASFQKLLDGNENKQYEQQLRVHDWATSDGRVLTVPLAVSRDAAEKTNKDAPLIFSTPIHFYGPRKTFATDSFINVLEGNEGEYSPAALRRRFGDKIVFVGATTHILKDDFRVPSFAQSDLNDVVEDDLPGVEIHATATAMLLDGDYIHTMSTHSTLWLLFVLTTGSSLWAASLRNLVSRLARQAQVLWTRFHLRGQIHTTTWISLYLILGALPIVLFWWAANWIFVHKHLWVIVAYPGLAAVGATGCVLLLLFGLENSQRRKIETHFTRIVSPELKAKMLATGEDYLEPEEIRLTVLFTDLEGFTTYSESHPPEEVIRVTNDFLSNVVPILYRNGGWVDKYIGDAIMAVFGAPVEYPDHAERALRSAIAMQDAAAEWRRRTGIHFYMRIGIHTGDVIAGYMGSYATAGSPDRMDYTVIGDTVNLASRLEGKNKEFGSWIMCSADSYCDAPEVVAAENVSASIKGKSQDVEVYIVRGLKDDPERDKNWAKNAI